MIVFYSVILNHHQAPVADEFWLLYKKGYRFVELLQPYDDINKGGRKYDDRPYLICAWRSDSEKSEALRLALTAEVCVFGGTLSLPYQKARLEKNLLSFEVGERWLKRGFANMFSPRLVKMIGLYHLLGWKKKPLYKLCASAYAANDQYLFGTFHNKCFKWGYFTDVKTLDMVEINKKKTDIEIIRIMWCGRFIGWKHPELPILLAQQLKEKGYRFIIDMYGSGVEFEQTKTLSNKLGVSNVVTFIGNKPNDEILQAMREHEIFLFTSDKQEGWGAVLNEAMSNGCTVVGSNAIGSVPFLVKDGVNGYIFKSGNLDSLCEKVVNLIINPEMRKKMAIQAYQDMVNIWSPKIAVRNLLQLIDDLRHKRDSTIMEGPCSKALPL